MKSLRDTTVMITGASSGFGLAGAAQSPSPAASATPRKHTRASRYDARDHKNARDAKQRSSRGIEEVHQDLPQGDLAPAEIHRRTRSEKATKEQALPPGKMGEDVNRIFVARSTDRRGKGGSESSVTKGLFAYLSLAQGFYYVVTALWALFSVDTFQKVTGPKTDVWLVKTVGVLVAAIGGALGVAGYRREETPEIGLLGAGSAAGLAGIDTYYAGKRRISAVYGLDALAELVFLGCWAYVLARGRSERR